ncbi:molybdopterin-synthase adenylyltransferase MoeB [Defluviimonas sp. WL0002]|uniref:Molybdopterin-synthase adenylyltransferase MoeB n=1 Tax=Albidovulum marisflavi TaxID=2984159 RepID=A0ABT2ZGM1_9RHOB|nr:molybdopterin-synthase adenylyltransferase MoeB [Defluviimonas sp. WL0002]MCV2870172.1 molybdopterin-synthase adenylyltransferase MoeB [Defluviimonas sp. WL0002]
MTVFLIAAAMVGFGLALRLPARIVWVMLGTLWVAVMIVHLALPGDHALTRAIGGSFGHWLVAGGGVILILLYRAALSAIRARARPAPDAPARPGTFSPAELDRYARHIVLREVGGPGQKRLKGAKVLVVGAGGLGSPALLYLAAAGVGTIGVVDDDTVSSSNLQRQVIHTDARIGQPKVFSAEAAMKALNPFIDVRPYNRRLSAEDAAALFDEYDLVLDGSDNFDTRYMVNAACVAAGKPLISAAITQWEGQISIYDPAHGAPCYACIFPDRPADGLAPACAVAGVMGALPGVVGAMMAVEAIKEITGAGDVLRGRMLIYDALYAEARGISLKRNPDCAVCGSGVGPA